MDDRVLFSRLLTRREFLHDTAYAGLSAGAGAFVLPALLRKSTTLPAVGAGTALGDPRLSGQPFTEEPHAGNWKTWVLRSGREIHLPTPTFAGRTGEAAELAQLKRAQLERTEEQIAAARFWDAGPATRRWTEIHLEMIKTHRTNPPQASRGLALVHLAMYDALIAAWHTKYAYTYPGPSTLDPTLAPAVRPRDNPSYPSEHAVAAGAASGVLSYLFPQQGEWLEAKAHEAAMSRLWAGADWPSAVDQGLALGRATADRVLARATTDGSNTPWDGNHPTGVCYWKPTPSGSVFPPLEPAWGKVKPWLLVNPDQLRPGPPPRCGSPEERAQYLEVYRTGISLTEDQKRMAWFWNDGPGTFTPPGHWFEMALGLAERHRLNTPRAARLCAYLGVVVMAAGVCVWDAKYAYWSLRPITYIQDYIDPNWTSLIPTPPFPGYVSGHSGFSGAAAEFLGYAIPQEKALLRSMAADAALSRLYGGIHTRADNDVGLAMGRLIGAVASTRALTDDIEDLVGRGVLPRRRGDALRAKLDGAVRKVNQKDLSGAIGELRTFVRDVSAELKPSDAAPFVTAAGEIIARFAEHS